MIGLRVEDLRRLDAETWLYAIGATKTDTGGAGAERLGGAPDAFIPPLEDHRQQPFHLSGSKAPQWHDQVPARRSYRTR